MFLLVPAHPGCPGQNPESRKTVVCVCACVCNSVLNSGMSCYLFCCYGQTSVKPQSKAAKAKKTKKSCKSRKASVRKGAAMSLIDKVLTTMDKHKEVT